jgi:hypothetical protein
MAEPSANRPVREAELEERVYRLETELAARLGTDDTELTNRLIARLSAMAAERERNPDTGPLLVLAASGDPPPPPPQGAVLHPPAPAVQSAPRTWFLANLMSELRLIGVMYFDPRYRISRTTQFVLPGLFLLLVFNYFFFSVWVSITFLSPVLERLLAVVFGMVIYLLLTRELARYRDVLNYLARYGR